VPDGQSGRTPSGKIGASTRSSRDHAWTKGSARVTADALDALGRAEEAKALREQYGVTSSDDPKP
jgi:hypothetical protein